MSIKTAGKVYIEELNDKIPVVRNKGRGTPNPDAPINITKEDLVDILGVTPVGGTDFGTLMSPALNSLNLRRGTNAERLTITPGIGELITTTDTNQLYIGDGVTVGGVPVSSANGGSGGDAATLQGYSASQIQGWISTTGDTAYSNAASYADIKASAAYTNAISVASTLATAAYNNAISKSISAYANAVIYADAVQVASFARADSAYSNAISFASNISGTAYTNAVSVAGSLAATAYSNAISYAISYADTKAASAYTNAIAYSGNASTAYSNAASYADGKAASAYTNAITYSGNATQAYTNAITIAANADNLSSGTINFARLPSNSSVSNTSIVHVPTANSVKTAYDAAISANTLAGAASIKADAAYANAIAYSGNATQAYSNAVSYADTKAASAYTNAVAFAANASNMNSGTVAVARLPLGNATSAGIVNILDSVTNTSITIAASTNSVKTSYDVAIAANVRAASAQSAAVSAYANAIAYSGNAALAYANAIAYSGNAALAYANAISFASNASNMNSGTVAVARLPSGNATSAGIVTIIDSVTNTSISIAASANSVKAAYDMAASAVSSGNAIAAYTNAITFSANINNLTSGRFVLDVLPNANVIYNLGSATAQWANIHTRDGIFSNSVGIGTTASLAKLQLDAGTAGVTTAILGSGSTGVSFTANWPGVGFNTYFSGGPKSLATGFGSRIALFQDNGQLSFGLAPSVTGSGTTQSFIERLTLAQNGYTIFNAGPGPLPGAVPYGTTFQFVGMQDIPARVLIDSVGTFEPVVSFRRSRGTHSAPSAVLSSDILLNIGAFGYGATGYTTTRRAGISVVASQNWTDTAQGTYLSFSTTADNTTTDTHHLRIDNQGRAFLGTTQDPTTTATYGGFLCLTRPGNTQTSLQLWQAGVGLAHIGLRANSGALSLYNCYADGLMANGKGIDIDTTGRVGIGTATPSNSLEVFTNGTSDPQTGGLAGMSITNTDTTINSRTGILFASYDSTGTRRHLGSIMMGKENSWTTADASTWDSYLSFWTRIDGGNQTERLRIASNGNVGIGTTSPVSRLEVRTDVASTTGPIISVTNLAGGAGSGGAINFVGAGAQNVHASIRNSDDGAWSSGLVISTKMTGASGNALVDRFRINSNGSVRINNGGSDNTALVVSGLAASSWAGLVTAHGSNGLGLYASGQGTGVAMRAEAGGSGIGIHATSGTGLAGYFVATNNNGLYAQAPAGSYFAGYFNGNAYATGIFQTSDENLKENIIPLGDALTMCKALDIKQFNWRKGTSAYESERFLDIGVIAQQAELVLPKGFVREIVAPKRPPVVDGEVDAPLSAEEILGTYKTVNPAIFGPMAIRAIQQLLARIEILEAKLGLS